MIAIGIGANSHAQSPEFAAALKAARDIAGGGDLVTTMETADFADHVRAAARGIAIEFQMVELAAMRERNDDCQTRSERTMALFGVASVAEAAALTGAGPGSRLIMARQVVGSVTIAAARSADKREPSP